MNSEGGTALLEPELADLEADDKKRLRKEKKRLYDAERTLEEWERYRALVDANDEAFEQIDVTNREARFALILMGALNAVVLVLLTRADALDALTSDRAVLGGGPVRRLRGDRDRVPAPGDRGPSARPVSAPAVGLDPRRRRVARQASAITRT